MLHKVPRAVPCCTRLRGLSHVAQGPAARPTPRPSHSERHASRFRAVVSDALVLSQSSGGECTDRAHHGARQHPRLARAEVRCALFACLHSAGIQGSGELVRINGLTRPRIAARGIRKGRAACQRWTHVLLQLSTSFQTERLLRHGPCRAGGNVNGDKERQRVPATVRIVSYRFLKPCIGANCVRLLSTLERWEDLVVPFGRCARRASASSSSSEISIARSQSADRHVPSSKRSKAMEIT